MCRHTVGLNWAAIGIEHVGTSDAQVLGDAAQMRSSLALTVWLMWRYQIPLANVIGHNESLSSPLHKELYAPWRCQTHADWQHADMVVYRAKLTALARRYGLRVGPTFRPRPTGCYTAGRCRGGIGSRMLATTDLPPRLSEAEARYAARIPSRAGCTSSGRASCRAETRARRSTSRRSR